MKKTLLTTTALVALAGAATAEITVSGTARLGLQTTEGTAAVAAGNGSLTTALITAATAANGGVAVTGLATAAGTTAAVTSQHWTMPLPRLKLQLQMPHPPLQKNRRLKYWIVLRPSNAATGTAAVAKTEDSTIAKNRVRVAFGLSGETDSGLEFGASIRADNAAAGNSGTGGSQYLSGSFGKISMGDLNGADEDMVGDISAMSLGGLGSNQEHSYQSSSHNLAYSTSMAGIQDS